MENTNLIQVEATTSDSSTRVNKKGWYYRGYIPHFDTDERIQHVTFHLADSLPKEVIDRMEEELKSIPEGNKKFEKRERLELLIDAGLGKCVLGNPRAASVVKNAILHFDGIRYHLYGWMIMPNHVHVLFQTIDQWSMATIVSSWKKFTARRINLLIDAEMIPLKYVSTENYGTSVTESSLWQRDYWDRYIRDEDHFNNVLEYIHMNPVKAGLVDEPENWKWSSAYNDGES